MVSQFADICLGLLPKVGIRTLSRTKFIPVLHVEKLHDESSFERALDFVERYWLATDARALLTVLTPMAPILATELQAAGFSEDMYRERITALAQFSDIGLHGHYLRDISSPCRPVHNYWNETSLIASQIARECEWLERSGLMKRRVYSAGWWHLDQGLVKTLGDLEFLLDFSASTTRFNDSPGAAASEKYRGMPIIFRHAADERVGAIWAVSSLGDSAAGSRVPRRALITFPMLLIRRSDCFLSLYSHDWDLNVDGAMKTVNDLKAHGAGFVSLDELVNLHLLNPVAREGASS